MILLLSLSVVSECDAFFLLSLFHARETVPCHHLFYAATDMRIHVRQMPLKDGKKLFTQGLAPNHPLKVMSSSVVVRAIKSGARDYF